MAGRSLQALALALRRSRASIRPSINTIDGRSASQIVDGPCLWAASSSGWRSSLGIFYGCSVPVSLRNSPTFGTCSSGSLVGPPFGYSGRGGGSVSYSTGLALDTREDRLSNAAEIGYQVLGPYIPDATKIKPQAAFAVVQVGSHQFKVSPGDMIYTEKLTHVDINDQLSLNKVLLLGSLKQTIIGRPIIPEAAVIAAVEEHALDAKVIVFKKKRRKNYRRTNGHRQELTRLRILHIEGIEDTSSVGVGTSSGMDTD